MSRILQLAGRMHPLPPVQVKEVVSRSRGFASCPFRVLGLKKRTTYVAVRTKFRELALQHHPDTNSGAGSSEEFGRIREAFEAIAEGPSGAAILREDCTYMERKSMDDNDDGAPNGDEKANRDIHEEYDNGFLLHRSVDPQVLREVVDVAKEMNPSGLDKGGMWAYANLIRNMAEDEEKDLPPLRVGEGDEATKESAERGKPKRRRRKRK
ncbi:hypothetical protein ACHAXT_003168 [Thalassiosira profunda]